MANGGVNYEDGIIFCAQGSMRSPSGLYEIFDEVIWCRVETRSHMVKIELIFLIDY